MRMVRAGGGCGMARGQEGDGKKRRAGVSEIRVIYREIKQGMRTAMI